MHLIYRSMVAENPPRLCDCPCRARVAADLQHGGSWLAGSALWVLRFGGSFRAGKIEPKLSGKQDKPALDDLGVCFMSWEPGETGPLAIMRA